MTTTHRTLADYYAGLPVQRPQLVTIYAATETPAIVFQVRVTNDPIQPGDFLLETHASREDALGARDNLEANNVADGRRYYVIEKAATDAPFGYVSTWDGSTAETLDEVLDAEQIDADDRHLYDANNLPDAWEKADGCGTEEGNA